MIESMCSTCRDAGLSEIQCVRGDCHDGCGDCRETAVAVGQIMGGRLNCQVCGRKLNMAELRRGEGNCDRCADEAEMVYT